MSWLRVRTIVRRHAYVLWRSPNRWFDIAFWPLMDVLLWGSLGTYVASGSPTSQAGAPYLLAGIMMFHVLFQTQIALNTGFMEETWSRNLLNVMVTPVTETEYVAGVGLFGVAKLALALITLSVTALAFFGFNLAAIGWSLVPIAFVLMISGWAIAFVVIGLMLRFGQSAEILAWGINFVVMAISGVFNPIEALPGPLQPIARLLPTTHAFIALRDVLAGEPLPWGQVVYAFIGSLVCLAMATGFCVHMLHVFRRRGFVTRFS
jgi:ABC-2 type transport system permease protein